MTRDGVLVHDFLFLESDRMGHLTGAISQPKLNEQRGVAIGCGLSPQIEDPYAMAEAATARIASWRAVKP